jgi:hypothetical protein
MRTPPTPDEEDGESQSEREEDEEDEENEEEKEEDLSALTITGCRRTDFNPDKTTRLPLQDSYKVRFRLLCKHEALKDDSGTKECKGTVVSADVDKDACCCRQEDSLHPLCIN